MNSLITNQLSRLLARVNYQTSAIELVSYAFTRQKLVLILGPEGTEMLSECLELTLISDEVNAILKKSVIYENMDWFVSTDQFSRLEALAFIKSFLLKSIPVPQLKVA